MILFNRKQTGRWYYSNYDPGYIDIRLKDEWVTDRIRIRFEDTTLSVPAHYDEEECLLYPPSRTLGFNPQLQLNDSLLVQSYIEAYDISYPEAMRRIESEVEELKEHLHNDGIYELNGLGTLTVNAEGNYEFAPCEAGILTPSLYGLGTAYMQKLGDKRLIPDVDAQAALTVQQNAARMPYSARNSSTRK